jgi:thermostable 8-oxoguanine DNA glycosylase
MRRRRLQQVAWAGVGASAELVVLPPRDSEAIEGVAWGAPDSVNTPAYWAVRCRWRGDASPDFASAGTPLVEEVGFCLLGGFGIKYEVNHAAFTLLKARGVFDPKNPVSEMDIRVLLSEKLSIEGSFVRYRFPNQRARRLHRMRDYFQRYTLTGLGPLELRNELMKMEGIGPKTASWIVRNHLNSDDVAIIDIHVVRACQAMKVFPESVQLPKDYGILEKRFLALAEAIEVRPSILDSIMWTEIRNARLNSLSAVS